MKKKSYNIQEILYIKQVISKKNNISFWVKLLKATKKISKLYFFELKKKNIPIKVKKQCLGVTKKNKQCLRFGYDDFCYYHKKNKNSFISSNKKITFIDLFSGIGSFHFALKKLDSKAECLLACDTDINCNKTYLLNYGVQPTSDILNLSLKQNLNCSILFAGFPCQTFSLMGKKTGLTNPNVSVIFKKLLSILEHNKIESFVFENVRHLVSIEKGVLFKKMLSWFEKLGYKVFWKVLNCRHFGIPQNRTRVFIVGLHTSKHRNSVFEFPKPFSKENTLSEFFNKDFIKSYSHTIRCGGRGSKITSSFNWANYYLKDGSIYSLTLDDCKKLQNFPDSFELVGSKTSKFNQLGNTIPTNLSFYIIKNLLKVLKN